jgi:hypothetical protein
MLLFFIPNLKSLGGFIYYRYIHDLWSILQETSPKSGMFPRNPSLPCTGRPLSEEHVLKC